MKLGTRSKQRPHVRLHKDATQSLTANTITPVLWAFSRLARGGFAFTGQRAKLVIPESGLYLMEACLNFPSGTGTVDMFFIKNNVAGAGGYRVSESALNIASGGIVALTTVFPFDKGDTVELHAFSNAAQNIGGVNDRDAHMSVTRID